MQFTTTRRSFVTTAAVASTALAARFPMLRTVTAQDADYPELTIIATDHAFDMAATAESGYTRLTLDNQGQADHHAIFFRINDDATPEQFQEALMSGDLGAVLGVSSAYGGPNAGPGGAASVIAWLDPGAYVAVCVVPDENGVPHAAHGMVAPLEVTESDAALDAPATDATVSLIDMAFNDLPAEVAAGPITWEVINAGPQLHELVILRLAEGLDVDGLMAILTGEGDATPDAAAGPPFMAVAGTAPMSQGAINFLEAELEPGAHVAICFIPDVETGMPHFLMGMIEGFSVI